VLAAIAALPAVLALAFAIVSGGGALASNDAGAPAGSFEQVTVMPGDTLWSIAEAADPASDPRDVVDEIVRLNAPPVGALAVGQTISPRPRRALEASVAPYDGAERGLDDLPSGPTCVG
jgi:hypothetical protein